MIDFNQIRDKIKQYQLSSLVSYILRYLKLTQKDENRRFPFWNLLVLLKWAYLYTTDFKVRKEIKPHEFEALVQLINDFESGYLNNEFKSDRDVKRVFRILAYQQFSHQERFYKSMIDRQKVLYIKLKSSYDIEKEFEDLTKVKLKPFFDCCTFLYIYFNKSDFDKKYIFDGLLNSDFFELFDKIHPESEIEPFLKLIALKSKEEFDMLQKMENERLQLYETNFYVTKPILFFQNQYHLIHKAVLVQFMKHFVYNFLKQNSFSFPEEFGKRQERYLELGLKEVNIQYKTENELRKLYSLEKVTDYLVNNNILIECKAIELHPRSGILRTHDIISNELNKSITKAYCQLLSTARVIDENQEWYGIIITYKEMYLGFGNDAWDEFLKTRVTEFCNQNNIDLGILPPNNLFFIDIESWDYIIQAIKDKKGNLKEILAKAKDLNTSENIAERIFLFIQVLEKHYKIDRFTLSYLVDEKSTV